MPHQQLENNPNKYEGHIEELQKRLARFLYEKILSETEVYGNAMPKTGDERILAQEAESESRKICSDLLDSAMDIDEDVDAMLRDKKVLEKYDYDGANFISRTGASFHRVLDGIHSLTTLTDNLRAYFIRNISKEQIVEEILESARKLKEEAAAALLNWKEYGVVSAVDPGLVGEWLEAHRTEKNKDLSHSNQPPAPMSQEEMAFFRTYEEQISSAGESKE